MDEGTSTTAEAAAPRSGIPLVLGPLLSPYRQHRHISVRVERLPHGARLSNGSNNGDRTWSLRLDDLDGLTYLLPDGMNEPHTLLVRVLNLDGDHGTTLATLDFPVSPGEAVSGLPPAATMGATPSSTADIAGDLESRQLRDQLTAVTASLAAREAELAEARQKLGNAGAEGSRQASETELAAARAAWEVELRDRLAEAAAEAATTLAKSRVAWQTEQEGRFTDLDARVEERVAQARELWQQEAKAALSAAEASWKADDAARLAAAEALWQKGSAQALAEAMARAERAETALAQARPEEQIGQARQLWQQEAEAALANAEATWKAEEAARLAAAEARWRKEPGRALADAQARADRAEEALAQARTQAEGDALEIHVLRDELKEVKAALALYETELAKARSAAGNQSQSADIGPQQRADPLMAGLYNDARVVDASETAARGKAGQQRPSVVRRLIRIAALLVILAMAVTFYPRVAPAIFERVWPNDASRSTATQLSGHKAKPHQTPETSR